MAAAIRPVKWDALEFETVTEMSSRREIPAADSALVQTFLRKGALVPLHAHEGAQWLMVQQGAIAVTIGSDRLDVGAGEVLLIPASVAHAVEALDDTLVVDWRSGAAALR